ncbi:transcription factor mef2A-like [Teleopsis dalmanni]|uniref:transcription factor mef2A-like n=1 Tax=Teleopsis dalmanni TaxID=139649 RepID=UPI0018CE41C0|nr:transcription factor mef2A-like [Teleopsis dalmanni]
MLTSFLYCSNYESPYRSTYSIPTSLGIRPYQQNNNSSNHNNNGGSGYGSNIQTPDSPRSTRSAPWPRSQQRSLFGNNPSSPRSVRSASTTGGGLHHHHQHQHHYQQQHHHQQHQQHQRHQANGAAHQRDHVPSQRYRSSSVESHSSNDSRSTRRHKHRHRRTSDNESELSRSSGRSGRSYHRKHRRSRHRRDSGGSDHESTRGRSYSGHRASSARSGSAELIDSALQWREVQRRQAEASLGQSSVHQASVSKSSMLARSLHSNDSHSDTHSHHKSRRHRKNKSPSDSRNRIWSSELAKHLQFDLVDTTGMTEDQLREIPYTVVETNSKRSNSNLKIHKSNSKNSVGGKSTGSGNTITNGSGSGNGQGKNRVDRIRGSHPTDNTGGKNGSIRSASTISSRECERNNGLVRMMSSMSMGDFISPTGSNLSPLENSALRVSHEHTDSGLGADQDYAYSSERSSDSTRYGTNKSSGASSGSHRKSAGAGSGSNYNNLMQQTVSNQQQTQRQNSFYAQRQQAQKQNFKFSQTNQNSSKSKSLAPIHNTHSSTNSANNNNSNTTNPGSFNEANTSKPSTNRLLNYTTFENNQYKFSLNNVFSKSGAAKSAGSIGSIGSGGVSGYGFTNNQMDSFLEWPNSPAAPYYYNGPPSTNVNMKKRDAKSDIGVPIRRLSGQAITKTQLLSGQLPNASCYPMPTAAYSVVGLASHLHPAKSDLFLSYMHSSSAGEYERPYIYNYKMPDMPEFMRPANTTTPQHQKQQQQQQQQQNLPQQTNTAYHISGAQTADPPPVYKPSNSGSINNGGGVGVGVGSSMLYGGAAPATDVMYYQFDNGKPPIVQQPKSLLNKTTNDPSSQMQKATTSANVVGPLVYLQHGQNVAPANATSTQQTVSSDLLCLSHGKRMLLH